MSLSSETISPTASLHTIEDCIQHARRNGLADFSSAERSQPRLPYVCPVRYCLDWAPSPSQSRPAFALNIGAGGMAISCREAITVGSSISLSLPCSDGATVPMEGTIVYCELDEKHYRAGIAFLANDDHNFGPGSGQI